MPIFWRYLLGQYIKVLILSTLSFVALLLVSRLEEIAEIASYGATLKSVALFALYQVPTILPIAIPLSALLSAYILFQRLSQSYELTAFRALGLSLKQILCPLLLAASLLGLINFFIASEIATTTHLKTRKMAHGMMAVNPLLLLQNPKIANLKGSYIQLDPVKQGSEAKNFILAVHNHSSGRLNLVLAKKLKVHKGELKGENVTIISSMPTTKKESVDHLMIENQREAKSDSSGFAALLKKGNLRVVHDHLNLSLLNAKLALHKKSGETFFEKNVQKCYSEIVRRLSLGVAPLTFTLLGASFAIEIRRGRMVKGLLFAMAMTAFSLVTFFIGKSFCHLFFVASFLFLIPHILMIYSSCKTIKRVNLGR